LTDPASDVDEVTLYSGRLGLVAALAGALILVVGPVIAMIDRGAGALGIAVVAIGTIGALAVAIDTPVSTRFSAGGVERRCLLRTTRFTWSQVDALERMGRRSRRRGTSGQQARPSRRHGGLLGVIDGRRRLLVDRPEGHAEHLRLRALVRDHAPHLRFELPTPSVDARPTDLYRRRAR
jgi:hypothetical protein